MSDLFDFAPEPEPERRQCDICGMTWFERWGHECPLPWSRERAESFLEIAEAVRCKGDGPRRGE